MPHIHEKIDFTTGIYVVHGDAVLLRKHEKYHAWLHLGGHIELDEDPVQGAIREAKEESGLDVRIVGTMPPGDAIEGAHFSHIIAPRFMNRHRIAPDGTHEHIDFIYFALADTRATDPRPEEQTRELRWLTRAELDDPAYALFPSVKFYCRTALDELASR